MNLLEHYIEEIVLEKPFKAEWTKQHKDKFVEVEMIVNVHGGLSSAHKHLQLTNGKKLKKKASILRNYKGGV